MKKNYASFLQRFVAVAIDAIIIGLVGSALNRRSGGFIITTLLGFVYAVWMLGMYRATIGKKVMKIIVVHENGKTLSYSDAAVRELSKYLSAIPLLLGYFWMLWDKKHQTWHDKIAGSVVLRK